jgi:abelson tyrosine-protein kinase 1
MNRLACLRLTERCADILMSVREEIAEAGDYVGEELRDPLTKLLEYDFFASTHFSFSALCLPDLSRK